MGIFFSASTASLCNPLQYLRLSSISFFVLFKLRDTSSADFNWNCLLSFLPTSLGRTSGFGRSREAGEEGGGGGGGGMEAADAAEEVEAEVEAEEW